MVDKIRALCLALVIISAFLACIFTANGSGAETMVCDYSTALGVGSTKGSATAQNYTTSGGAGMKGTAEPEISAECSPPQLAGDEGITLVVNVSGSSTVSDSGHPAPEPENESVLLLFISMTPLIGLPFLVTANERRRILVLISESLAR